MWPVSGFPILLIKHKSHKKLSIIPKHIPIFTFSDIKHIGRSPVFPQEGYDHGFFGRPGARYELFGRRKVHDLSGPAGMDVHVLKRFAVWEFPTEVDIHSHLLLGVQKSLCCEAGHLRLVQLNYEDTTA